ncbi:MAG TPA: hypothetical protein VLD84_07340 [Nitrososphaeraceae archaeon]|nr:hypothetical protein [Nitrososphaeraceae archaeon]
MNLLSKFAEVLERDNCKQMVKRTANEFVINAEASVGNVKVKGDFSNKLKELTVATSLAADLDNTQYLLCKEIANLKDSDKLRDDCRRIRLQIILGFSQLKTIIDTSKEDTNIDLKKDLVKWVKYMRDLHKLGIELLKPCP